MTSLGEAKIREAFEALYANIDKYKYTDLECTLLEIPLQTYKHVGTQKTWEDFHRRMAVKNSEVGSVSFSDNANFTKRLVDYYNNK